MNHWPLDALGLTPRGERPRAAVLGLARSGRAAARLLLSRGVKIELLDLKLDPAAQTEIDELVAGGATLRIGPHDPSWLDAYDLVVKSPGIPPRVPFLIEASRRGLVVIGEVELAWLAARGAVLAITGTNGKSTTTAWAGDMLARAGIAVQVGGNIGRPFADCVLADPTACFVIETSSFQIADSKSFRPRVAALLNFTPDHLDYHADLAEYREAKLSLFDRMGPDDVAVIGPDDTLATEVALRSAAAMTRFRLEDRGEEGGFLRDGMLLLRRAGEVSPLVPAGEVSLPGPHNLENGLAAAISSAILGAPTEPIRESLRRFSGLPHRLERVATVRGRRFVNDSKATNTDSLSVALRSFAEPVVLIAGGRDKGQDFAPLRPLVEARVETLILIGEGAPRLEAAWGGKVRSVRAGSLREAVETAFAAARSGQTVLLSPACASFDMFRNYEDRGARFREETLRLLELYPEEHSDA